MRRFQLFFLAALLGAAAALGASISAQTGDVGSAAADSLLEHRVDGCEVCRRMTADILPGEFYEDAHEFACASCHHPHVRHTGSEWKDTCTSAGCHPRAWTRTVFHRLSPDVFLDCRNCHKPHVWTADGTDCAGCHEDVIHDPEAFLSPTLGVEFSHGLHDDLDCATCHDSSKKHASLVMTTSAECQDCHHSDRISAACADCHRTSEVGPREWTVAMAGSAWPTPLNRDLPFDHARHENVPCARCHAEPSMAVIADCAGCHEEHHGDKTDCATCHATPPSGAHERAVHRGLSCTGSACHGGGAKTLTARENVCRSCHQDLGEHRTGIECAYCHLLAPGP